MSWLVMRPKILIQDIKVRRQFVTGVVLSLLDNIGRQRIQLSL